MLSGQVRAQVRQHLPDLALDLVEIGDVLRESVLTVPFYPHHLPLTEAEPYDTAASV
jgi:hypothetical protein